MADDTRPRVALNGRTIDLAALSIEVSTALSASATEVVVADPASPVTAKQLADAIAAHVPPVKVDHDAEFRKAVEAASTLAALKAAILGNVGPGAQARTRP